MIYEFLRTQKRGLWKPGDGGFAPFVSTRRGGYGLGLWETRRIVEANGGSTHSTSMPSLIPGELSHHLELSNHPLVNPKNP